MKRFLTAVLVSVALASVTGKSVAADCGELTIPATDTGWYDASGYHDPSNDNYFCGDDGATHGAVRNWFVFAIPVLTQQVVSASLYVRGYTVVTTDAGETYQLRHVSTAPTTLRAGGTGLSGIYADLGDGAIYGSRIILAGETNQYFSIPLNDAFISNLVARAGSDLAMGGEITTLDTIFNGNEYLFGGSSGQNASVQLLLTFSNASPLTIRTQPQSQNISAADNVTFNVEACGSSALSYQWQFNGANLPATAASLTLFNVTSNDSGPYRVIVTNLSGAATSAVAVLTVLYQPPTATAYVALGTSPFYVGNSLTLCANVGGIPFPRVQWQFNGADLPFATSPCLSLDNLQTNQSGEYRIVASNVLGVVTSEVVSVVVTPPPPVYAYFSLGAPPIAVGSYVYFCAAINLDPFPALQWQFNGADLAGQTNQCFYIGDVGTNHAGFYSVIASNISGVYTSPPIELTVFYAPPFASGVYFPIGGPSVLAGNDVVMCPGASGSPPLTFRWRLNDVELEGNNVPCLSLFGVSTNQAGIYSVVVSNSVGVITSIVTTLTVDYQPPIFISQPVSQSVVEGATVRFTAFASAGPPAAHVLRLNGTNLPVSFTYENGGGFTLLDVLPADSGSYQVVASNSLGTATSQVAVLTVTPAGPLDRWTQRNPLPQSQRLFGVANSSNLFVAVGDHGTVLTSADATNWFVQSRRVDLALDGVAFGGGMFVAVGETGTILVSADGTNWSFRSSTPNTELNAITYGNGRFVAVGHAPFQTIIMVSSNGVAWDKAAAPGLYAGSGVAFGNGTFVAAGLTAIITSSNGLDWSVALGSLDSQLESVSFVQDQFIAVGDEGYMLASIDGLSWGARNSGTTRRLLGVTYGNGRFVAAGVRGTITTSTDAGTWAAATSGTPDRLETVAFGNGLFIAAGENGTIITSANGTSWTKQNRGATRDLDGMAVANGTIVVAGKGGSILTSLNGLNYTEQDTGVTNDLHGVTWANGQWLAVGEPGAILTSPDAVQWTSRATTDTNSLKGAAYGNGKWVVVGTQGATLTSDDDGLNWSAGMTSPDFDLNDIAFGNGTFVIVGDGFNNQNGSCFVSTNGVVWTWVNSYFFDKNLRNILFANGLFFVTGNDGQFFTSTNGVNWNTSSCGFFTNLRGATREGGLWIMVGNRGTILTSPNLLNWTLRPTRTFENLHEVVYLDGSFVTIGNRGTVLQSDRLFTELDPPRYLPGGPAIIELKGVFNGVHRLQASPDCRVWANIFRLTNGAGPIFVTDSNAVAQPRRFYRMVKD